MFITFIRVTMQITITLTEDAMLIFFQSGEEKIIGTDGY